MKINDAVIFYFKNALVLHVNGHHRAAEHYEHLFSEAYARTVNRPTIKKQTAMQRAKEQAGSAIRGSAAHARDKLFVFNKRAGIQFL